LRLPLVSVMVFCTGIPVQFGLSLAMWALHLTKLKVAERWEQEAPYHNKGVTFAGIAHSGHQASRYHLHSRLRHKPHRLPACSPCLN